VPQGFFSMLNPFMHSKMDFEQQKIVISCKFISPDSGEKKPFRRIVRQLRNRQKNLNWEERFLHIWIKYPWKDLAFLIQKLVTCEGEYSLIFLYHIRLLMHLKNEKPLNMPYYLLIILTKMSKTISEINKKY
jgi:hypothetical protein